MCECKRCNEGGGWGARKETFFLTCKSCLSFFPLVSATLTPLLSGGHDCFSVSASAHTPLRCAANSFSECCACLTKYELTLCRVVNQGDMGKWPHRMSMCAVLLPRSLVVEFVSFLTRRASSPICLSRPYHHSCSYAILCSNEVWFVALVASRSQPWLAFLSLSRCEINQCTQ